MTGPEQGPWTTRENDVKKRSADRPRLVREGSRWTRGLGPLVCGFVGVSLVPRAAYAHGQEGLVPFAGITYAFALFVLVAIGLPARMRTKLWCIAAYIGSIPVAWLATAP